MRREAVRIIVLGRLGASEAVVVDRALAELPTGFIVERFPLPATDWLKTAATADLCIVLESWPDEFPRALVQALVESCLTGRLICCQGPWCASSGRTRGHWPNAVCVPVEQFAGRLQWEIELLAGAGAPLPFTAARDEVFAAVCAQDWAATSVRVKVESPDAAYARELTAALNCSPDAEPMVLLLDVDPLGPRAARQLIERRRSQSAVPIIAIAGFPSAAQRAELMAAGATAVVARLSPLREIANAIGGAR